MKSKGGFAAMGLSYPVVKDITKRGYKIPTKVQRKTIRMILEVRYLLSTDEKAHLLDLYAFLNRSQQIMSNCTVPPDVMKRSMKSIQNG